MWLTYTLALHPRCASFLLIFGNIEVYPLLGPSILAVVDHPDISGPPVNQ